MTKIKPYGERVVVKRLDSESTTSGGIIIPEASKEQTNKAEIVATNDTEFYNVGSIVILPKFGGTKVKDDKGNDLFVVKNCDIIAVCE